MVNLAHAKKAGVTPGRTAGHCAGTRATVAASSRSMQAPDDRRGGAATPCTPTFDKSRVAVYGYQNPGPGGMTGQTEWSHFAVSNGFRFQDRPWGLALPLRRPEAWLKPSTGWPAWPAAACRRPTPNVKSLGAGALFVAGKVAMVPDGAWKIGYFAAHAKFENAWVPLPRGPWRPPRQHVERPGRFDVGGLQGEARGLGLDEATWPRPTARTVVARLRRRVSCAPAAWPRRWSTCTAARASMPAPS